jgi:hypothetical protein
MRPSSPLPKIEEMLPHSGEANYAGSLVIVGRGGLPDVIRDHFLKLAGGKSNGQRQYPINAIPTLPADASTKHIVKTLPEIAFNAGFPKA